MPISPGPARSCRDRAFRILDLLSRIAPDVVDLECVAAKTEIHDRPWQFGRGEKNKLSSFFLVGQPPSAVIRPTAEGGCPTFGDMHLPKFAWRSPVGAR